MHPPLFRPHPLCEEYVNNLVRCHEDHNIAKFFGHCNDIKTLMDRCFREEKEIKRSENMRKAREDEERFQRRLKQMGDSKS